MFRAVRGMDPGGTRRYRLLAEILTFGLSGDRRQRQGDPYDRPGVEAAG